MIFKEYRASQLQQNEIDAAEDDSPLEIERTVEDWEFVSPHCVSLEFVESFHAGPHATPRSNTDDSSFKAPDSRASSFKAPSPSLQSRAERALKEHGGNHSSTGYHSSATNEHNGNHSSTAYRSSTGNRPALQIGHGPATGKGTADVSRRPSRKRSVILLGS